jgi:hypothetical protein
MVALIPLLKIYLPSCVSLFIKDMSMVNGENYWIFSNFLGNTFDNVSLEARDKHFWYGFQRQGFNTETFIGDGAGMLQIWFYAILMLFIFNFLKALFPKE